MGSFTFSEILMILVVILVVFGPKRLPELARRAGELVAKTRDATRSVTQALEHEYGDQAQPFRDLKDQFDGVRDDLRSATGSITDIGATPASEEDDGSGDVDGEDDPAA
jgi:Tat protein translocase TatB subunit